MARFGEKLLFLRTSRGLTLKELAVALGHSAHGYISELETGKKQPTTDFVLKVARLFNVSVDQLLRDELDLVPATDAIDSKDQTLAIPLIERPPTSSEVEKLRLVLSTFQDGSGQLALPDGLSLPGWRDFERSIALIFDGYAQESKAIFDVLIPDPNRPTVQYGVSCKMRGTLNDSDRTGRATIELSNSSGKFWQALGAANISQGNYRQNAVMVGNTLLTLIKGWHGAVGIDDGGNVDIGKSCYLVLSWNRFREYQLHQFSLSLPVSGVEWSFPEGQARLVGHDEAGKLYEWYGESGGQLKYYPRTSDALWASKRFSLEPLPTSDASYGLMAKAATYFPEQWSRMTRIDTNSQL